MAKVKTKTKAQNSAVKKKNCKQKSLAGHDEAIKGVKVMRRASDLRLLTSDEKVHYLLENGLRLGKKLAKEKTKKKVKEIRKKKIAIIKPKINYPSVRDRLMTRSGRLRKKRTHDFNLISNILQSELMIGVHNRQKPKININSTNKTNNNNDKETKNKNKKNKSVNKTKNKILKKKIKPKKSYAKRAPRIKSIHPSGLRFSPTKFICDYCKKEFNKKFSLSRHIYHCHMGMKGYNCSYCPKTFRYLTNMKVHEKKQHADLTSDSIVYLCDICEKPFLMKENLSTHLASHVKNENSYKCIYCDRGFSHHLLLNQHEKQHLVMGRYQCTLCSLSYEYRNQLAAHVKSHLKIRDFICQYCGKEFLRLNSLRRHVQISHAGHRIQCPICNKSLKGHLSEHMRTHEKKRPHECPDCGQSFIQSTQLNVHRRSHTGYKPYKCRICNKSFSHSNALMLHIRRHTGEKPFICPLCPFSFSQLPHMKAHMRNIHGKDNPYMCKKCNQFFKLKVQLESHAKLCKAGDKKLSFKDKIEDLDQAGGELDSATVLTRMRFLLALLFTMIASKEKLKFLGFNKRLIDELLWDSLEAMGVKPCSVKSFTTLQCLKENTQMLLNNTVPKQQLEKFQKEKKTTIEILELLTDEKKKAT